MVFKKGDKRPEGAGKRKGSANKSTTLAREAIAKFVDNNTSRLELWLDQIAEESPKDAFDCFTKVMEYHLPKLQRTEQSGLDGGPIEHSLQVEFISDKKEIEKDNDS